MEIAFTAADGKRTSLVYDKVLYEVEGVAKGLRYGENPDQAAALYKPIGGNLALGGALLLEPGEGLVSAAELLQFGKHPGKTNLTDVDSALAYCAISRTGRPAPS